MANSSNRNEADEALWRIAGPAISVVVLGLVTWYLFRFQISWIVIKFAQYNVEFLLQIYAALVDIGINGKVLNFIIPAKVVAGFEYLRDQLPLLDPKGTPFNYITEILTLTGYTARLFIPFIAIFSSWYLWSRTKAARMTRRLDIYQLAQLNMKEFPQIRPAIISNLLEKNPEIGPHRREDTPIRFAIKHGLIQAYKKNYKGQLIDELFTPTFSVSQGLRPGFQYIKDDLDIDIPKIFQAVKLSKEKTAAVFIKQLGPRWIGSKNLPTQTKALYAIFIAHGCAGKVAAHKLMDQFNRSWFPARKGSLFPLRLPKRMKLNMSGVDKLIAKYEKDDRVQQILGQHAYQNTMLARLLEFAREKGKVTSSCMLWLKVEDRTLWYTINQEGGQTAWTEAAGPRGHLLAEKAVMAALHQPFVTKAVEAFEEYLSKHEQWIAKETQTPNEETGKIRTTKSDSFVQFAINIGLIQINKNGSTDHLTDRVFPQGLIDSQKEKLAEAFIKQIGPLWEGSEYLSIPRRVLFAILIGYACGNKKAASTLMEQLNQSWALGRKASLFPPRLPRKSRLNTDGVKLLIETYENSDLLQQILKRHSFETTMFAGLLEFAKTKSSIATESMLWLKAEDRTLWCLLNQASKQTDWIESAGPWCHFLEEKKNKRPLSAPSIGQAMKDFEEYDFRHER